MMHLVALGSFNDDSIRMPQNDRAATVVDPDDATLVTRALAERGLDLAAILVTPCFAGPAGSIDPRQPASTESLHATDARGRTRPTTPRTWKHPFR